MATIDRKEVEYLAGLARIDLSEAEKEQLQGDLSKILEYVDALKQVNTDGLPEISQVTGLKNVLRSDEPGVEGVDTQQLILKGAPQTQDGLVKVKAIFN